MKFQNCHKKTRDRKIKVTSHHYNIQVLLTLCMLGNFSCFFQKKSFRNTFIVSNGLDPGQDQHVGPDLGPNCLQR